MNHQTKCQELEVIFLMRESCYQQYAIIQADSATLLTDRLNDKLRELKDKEPIVTFDGFTARICYTERFDVPEDLSDAWSLKGVRLTCSQCPFFEPIEKQDGTPDQRRKWGKCPCADGLRAYSDGPACDSLFKMLNNGEVAICFAK